MPRILFDVDTYRTRFTGGSRQFLFYILLKLPAGISREMGKTGVLSTNDGWKKWFVPAADSALTTFGLGSDFDKWPYLIRSTTIPESMFDEIPIPWQSLDYKIAGYRKYGDWSVDMNVDINGDIIERMYSWQNIIQNSLSELKSGRSIKREHDRANSTQYMQDQEVHMIDYSGNVVKSFVLEKCWPKSVGNITFDYASSELLTMNVVFTFYKMRLETKPSTKIADAIKRGYEKLTGIMTI
ncbi:MAG TPA: hypothetical protein P5293_00345 [Bacteroidales bacterium]|nr:hypothetical protein [Bacteroidales bacterium]